MFEVGAKVVYAAYGVCVVSESHVMKAVGGGAEKPYYVINPLRDRGGTVFVPMDKEDALRPIMTREEALALVGQIDTVGVDEFRDNNSRTVEDYFKKQLRGSDCRTAMRVANTMRARMDEQRQKKHLPSSMYTRICDQATFLVRSELCASLGVTDEELNDFIEQHK